MLKIKKVEIILLLSFYIIISPPFSSLAASYFDDFTNNSISDYQLTHTWQQGGTGSLVYDISGKRLNVITGNDIGLMLSHVLPQLTEGVFGFDFMPTVKYPSGGIIKIRLIQDHDNYYEITNTDGYGASNIEKIVNGSVVDANLFLNEYTQNSNYHIAINFSSNETSVNAFGQELFINTNIDSIIVNRFEIEIVQQDGYFDNIECFEPATGELSLFFDDFTNNSISDYQLTHTWQQGGTGSLVYDISGKRLNVITGNDIGLMFSHVLPQLTEGVFGFDFMPAVKYPNGGIIKIHLIQDQDNYYEITNTDGYGASSIEKIVNGSVVDANLFSNEYTQNSNYHIAINFSSNHTNVNAFGQEIFINTNTDSIIVNKFEIELIQQDGYFDNIEYFEPVFDIESPVWNDTTGICSVTDNATSGSLTVEFGSATDSVDGSDIKYNIYYAPSPLWNNDIWTDNSSVLNAQVNSGADCTYSYILSGLQTNVEYTVGVRVCDTSGNEDKNTAVLSVIVTGESSLFFDDFTNNSISDYQLTHTWQQGGTGSLAYDISGKRLNVITGNDIGLMLSHVLPQLTEGVFGFDFMPTVKYPSGGIIKIRLIQDHDNYYEITNSDGYGAYGIEKIVNGSVVDSNLFSNEYSQNSNYHIAINFSSNQTSVNAFGQEIFINTNTDSIFVNRFEIEIVQQNGYFDNIFYTIENTHTLLFLDNFSDGNADGWSIIDDSYWNNPGWEVINGEYCQTIDIKGFQESYHLGSYAYYESGTDLTDYQASVKIIPNFIEENSRDTIGIMFRYINNDNYYRFSMSRFQGFSRLEKKVDGEFSTLAVNGRGFEKDVEQIVTVEADGAKIFVYVNQSPLFAVIDNSHNRGTIALYSLSKARFDDVKISALNTQPEVILSQPVSFFIPVAASDQITDQLIVSSVVRNLPMGGSVGYILDGEVSDINIINEEPFLTAFFNVLSGYHDIEAVLFDGLDNMLYGSFAKDTNENIGMAGDIFVAIGDSITQGLGDDFESDDLSVNGTNISRGFTPVLTDHLSSCLNNPVTVINEGIGGTFSYDGAYRLASTIQRHTKALYWLIAFGTNDARAPISLPSGVLCIEDDCGDTFKEYMRSMIIELQDAGKIPVLALVPFSPDMTVAEDLLVKEYNQVISDLIEEHNLIVEAPDFYTYFKNNTNELFDGLHPNGQGYIKMADMWRDVLTDPVTGIMDCN